MTLEAPVRLSSTANLAMPPSSDDDDAGGAKLEKREISETGSATSLPKLELLAKCMNKLARCLWMRLRKKTRSEATAVGFEHATPTKV